jgi:hypothetical protein
VIYLLPGSTSLEGYPDFFGCMITPHRLTPSLPILEGRAFGVDNQCFTKPFNPHRMYRLLQNLAPYRAQCRFVTVPDIPWVNNERVFDAQITVEMFEEYANHMMFKGWPLAYVAQNGAESLPFPEGATTIFIGGDTAWKCSEAALSVIRRAHEQGLWTHVGRVNSKKRLTHFRLAHACSSDGTGAALAPTRVMKQLNHWLAQGILPFAP